MLKTFLIGDLALAGIAAANYVDTTAEKVVLYAAAVGAALMLWRTILRPTAKIVARTVDAVEALETLPQWREEHDERLADVEAEVGIVHRDVTTVANDVAAIRRDLGITDEDVRSPASAPPPRIRGRRQAKPPAEL